MFFGQSLYYIYRRQLGELASNTMMSMYAVKKIEGDCQ